MLLAARYWKNVTAVRVYLGYTETTTKDDERYAWDLRSRRRLKRKAIVSYKEYNEIFTHGMHEEYYR